MRNPQSCLALVLAGLLLTAIPAWSSISGSISGVVTDPTSAVISGATVSVVDTQTGIRSTLTTDSKGFYNFPALPVGTYDLEISQIGFKEYRKSGLVVDANSALRVDAVLSV